MVDYLLSNEDYSKLLYNCFKKNLKCISYSLKPLDNVEGLLGEHYKLTLTYLEDDETKSAYFFIKTKPKRDKTQCELLSQRHYYPLETYLYNILFPEFEKYGLDTSFAPKCYLCIENETMVMEDKIFQGFFLPERNKFFSFEECIVVLKSLALLHVAGYIYEKKRSDELGRQYNLDLDHPELFDEEVFVPKEKRTGTVGMMVDKSIEFFIELIQLLPENENFKKDFSKKLRESEPSKIFLEKNNIKKTLTHGDLWSNNMLFKLEDNKLKHCCLVDYQMARYFYPAFDVIIFLHSNTEKEFRDIHYKNLMEFYYETLSSTFNRYGYSVNDFYTKSEFEQSIKLVDFVAKLHAYIIQSFAWLPRQLLTKSMTTDQDGFNKLLYKNRSAIGVLAFTNNASYRKLLTDYLYELHKCLC